MGKKLVIIGGVAGGATAAARARRLSEDAEIVMFERGPDVSFANCGLPYHIGGEIEQRDSLLVQTKAGLEKRFNLDIRTQTEVTQIDREAKCVHARDLNTGREYTEPYDVLLLSPGASPVVPPIPGIDHPRVYTLRNMPDMDRIKQAVAAGAKSALVVGGGFIGLEMAENLRRHGMAVTVVEMLPQVMPPIDQEFANRVHLELGKHGVTLHLSDGVTEVADAGGAVRATLKSGAQLTADMLVLSVGVRPDSQIAAEAGLDLTERGAIVVNEQLQTSDPSIYAVGDAVQVRDAVLGGRTTLPLAGPANRQGRLAVDHIFGRSVNYHGVYGTSVVRVFDLTVASTGANEKTLQQRDVAYEKIYATRGQHVGYFPGAQPMIIKLLYASDDGTILGAQIVGGDGVDKRIDVLATAMQSGLKAQDLAELELAYAPQYGAAKDPVNIAGYIAANALRCDERFVYAESLDDAGRREWTIVDVRERDEYETGHIPGALHIPLGALRERLAEIPTDKSIATYCGVGQRSYYANRILGQRGLEPYNLAGGFGVWELVHRA